MEEYRKLLEQRLAEAIAADLNTAPFGLMADEARGWHAGRAVAYQYALEMLPAPRETQFNDDEIMKLSMTGHGYRFDCTWHSMTVMTNRPEDTKTLVQISLDGRWYIPVAYPETPGECPACRQKI